MDTDMDIKFEETHHTFDKIGEILKIRPCGPIDPKTIPALEAKVLESFQKGDHRLVLDLSETQYFNSTGLGLLINLAHRASLLSGGLRLINVAKKSRFLFSMLEIENYVLIFDTLEEAAKSFENTTSTNTTITKKFGPLAPPSPLSPPTASFILPHSTNPPSITPSVTHDSPTLKEFHIPEENHHVPATPTHLPEPNKTLESFSFNTIEEPEPEENKNNEPENIAPPKIAAAKSSLEPIAKPAPTTGVKLKKTIAKYSANNSAIETAPSKIVQNTEEKNENLEDHNTVNESKVKEIEQSQNYHDKIEEALEKSKQAIESAIKDPEPATEEESPEIYNTNTSDAATISELAEQFSASQGAAALDKIFPVDDNLVPHRPKIEIAKQPEEDIHKHEPSHIEPTQKPAADYSSIEPVSKKEDFSNVVKEVSDEDKTSRIPYIHEESHLTEKEISSKPSTTKQKPKVAVKTSVKLIKKNLDFQIQAIYYQKMYAHHTYRWQITLERSKDKANITNNYPGFIVPVLPGCHVVPNKISILPNNPKSIVEFWVTPHTYYSEEQLKANISFFCARQYTEIFKQDIWIQSKSYHPYSFWALIAFLVAFFQMTCEYLPWGKSIRSDILVLISIGGFLLLMSLINWIFKRNQKAKVSEGEHSTLPFI